MEAEKDKMQEYFRNEPIKETSADFTKLVMDKVEHLAETPFVIKPLIAKRQWMYIMSAAILVVSGSFIIELISAIQDFTPLFSWENIDFSKFITTFKIGIGVIALLAILTAADIIYRKMKHLA